MTAYRLLTDLAAPAIALYLRHRRATGREDQSRFHERLGYASAPRPKGKLVWCHAASVGEAMSVLALIRRLRETYPTWSVLLTTGTVTSAKLLEGRLPEGATHHYVPVDRWPYVTRFLDHWQPDLALWVESELWPNMLGALKERRIPAVLLNGRLSERSFKRWRLLPGGAREMMRAFVLGLAQTEDERKRFAALGLRDVRCVGNLKFAADPLPFDRDALADLKMQIGARPFWLMASTHPGEEEIALRTHEALRAKHPGLLTILVPRHPARGDEIAALLETNGLSFIRRSVQGTLTQDTQIYLADTMGEMGLFYRLSRLCCLAGSFTWGGHNPIEPAQLDCAVLFGPKMDNFRQMAGAMTEAGAALQVKDETALQEKLDLFLTKPDETRKLADAAHLWAENQRSVLAKTMDLLSPFFSRT